MPIGCKDQDLDFLGSAYPLFFSMTFYFIVLILLLFLFGGSLRVLIRNWQCETDCITFFGMMVIMDSQNQKEQFDGEWYDLIITLILMIAILIIKPLITANINDFNISFLDPASYSIAMKNLPNNVTKEEIIQFFNPILNEKSKREKGTVYIEKINFVYSVDPYFTAFNTKVYLSILLRNSSYGNIKPTIL